ncbi:MAG: hypothetical protein Tsb0014_47660 [Pleurocapsa sp.]
MSQVMITLEQQFQIQFEEDKKMEKSIRFLKVASSFAVASFAIITIPFVDVSAEAMETDTQSSSRFLILQNNLTQIEMTPEDAEYIQKIREHYNYE